MSSTEVPAVAGEPGEGLRLVLPGRRTSAGEGWTWIALGWRLFARSPLMWILSILVVFVIAFLVGLVPVVGSLAFQAVNPAIAAGFVVACRSLERGGDFELEHLFAGFRTRFPALLVVGLLVLAGWVVIFLVFAGFAGFAILGAAMQGDAHDVVSAAMASALPIALGGLLALALMVPLLAAYWFAPALVIMHGVAPVEAMKASFAACMVNFVPFLVYGLVMAVFAVLATIPFGLGYLVWVPLAISSTYAAYRAIFTEPGPEAASAG